MNLRFRFFREGGITVLEENVGLSIFLGLFGFILYIGLIALGLFLTYLIIKWAINRSRVNENLEALRRDIQQLNARLQALQPAGGAGSAGGAAVPSAAQNPASRPDQHNG